MNRLVERNKTPIFCNFHISGASDRIETRFTFFRHHNIQHVKPCNVRRLIESEGLTSKNKKLKFPLCFSALLLKMLCQQQPKKDFRRRKVYTNCLTIASMK